MSFAKVIADINLPDHACKSNELGIHLRKVGNQDIEMYRRDFTDEQIMTRQAAYVSLSKDYTGVHMSRLIGTTLGYEGEPISLDDGILIELAESHNSPASYWECHWASIYSIDDVQRIRVNCSLEGVFIQGVTRWFVTIVVPYASVCPCSAEMTKVHGGIPHMQRADVKITGEVTGNELDMLIPSLIGDILDAVKVYPIPFMKREDELRWCQNASEYNYFVEDACRLCGQVAKKWFTNWLCINTHYESIHQHNVVATCGEGDIL